MKKLFLVTVVLCVLLASSSAFAENTLSGLLRLDNSVTVDKTAGMSSAPLKIIGISGIDSTSHGAKNGFFYTLWLNNDTTPRHVELNKIGLAVGVRWLF